MSQTLEIVIGVTEQGVRDELIAQLSDINFDAFEEKETELCAYIQEELFAAEALDSVLKRYHLSYRKSVIGDQNWNALWESSFQPVTVADFCRIRAEFHTPDPTIEHEIVITPKMSFGTGHHATTYMMISQMRTIEFKEKKVADFGTGTGVLAILASKLGSGSVWAIDNDEWSIENSRENVKRNGCENIRIEKANGFLLVGQFDIILANINKNVILSNAGKLISALLPKGQLLLSGLYSSDEDEVKSMFTANRLEHVSTLYRNNWVCMLLQKQAETTRVC